MAYQDKFRDEIAVDAAFLAKRVHDLYLLILKQAPRVYEEKGIIFPVVASSLVLFLSKAETASPAQMARALGHPHQLIAQRIKTLLKLRLIAGAKDPGDKRRTLYRLTEEGQHQSALLEAYSLEAAEVFTDLSNEVGVDLHAALNKACIALETKSFSDRFPSSNKETW